VLTKLPTVKDPRAVPTPITHCSITILMVLSAPLVVVDKWLERDDAA